jgi:hypothetical protein
MHFFKKRLKTGEKYYYKEAKKTQRFQKFERIVNYDFYFLQGIVIEIGELIFQCFELETKEFINLKCTKHNRVLSLKQDPAMCNLAPCLL